MICTTMPVGVRRLADRYKDIFSDGHGASYSNLCALFCYFLLAKKSISEFVRSCPWSHSVSDLSRAVICFDQNRFMRRHRQAILRHYKGGICPEHFCWAVDDTANPKYGASIFRSSSWHGSKGAYYGQKIMVLALVDIRRGIALPVGYVIATKKDDPDYKSGPDLLIDLVQQALAAGLPRLPLTVDSWFDSVELMGKIEAMGMSYVGELKSNRNAKVNPSPKAKWKKLRDSFSHKKRGRLHCRLDSLKIRKRQKKAKCAAKTWGYIKNRKSPLNLLAVYNRRNGKKAFAYYASTDLSMSGARIWEIMRARWKIECLFRDLKQNLSFGCLPIGGEKAADLAICLPFLLLTSLRLDGKSKWAVTSERSIGEMTDQIKQTALEKAIDLFTSHPTSPLVTTLKSRRSKDRLNRKPVDSIAEAA